MSYSFVQHYKFSEKSLTRFFFFLQRLHNYIFFKGRPGLTNLVYYPLNVSVTAKNSMCKVHQNNCASY